MPPLPHEHDHLLLAKVVQNPNWGIDAPKKKQERPKKLCKSFASSIEFHWLLKNDIDVEIGLGNNNIRDMEDIDFNNDNDVYFSYEEEEGSEISQDESNAEYFSLLELLYALSSSARKRWCKRESLNLIIYEKGTYIFLETGEEQPFLQDESDINLQHYAHNIMHKEGNGKCRHGR